MSKVVEINTKKPLKIALLGTRGVPARYGGFETFAEKLSERLVSRGHEVVVACRRPFFGRDDYGKSTYKGIKRVCLPTFRHKYLETPVHAAISFLYLLFNRPDVVLLCNAANSPFAWLVRLQGIPLLVNVDGIERERAKWNALGKWWYALGEYCSKLFATKVVADAEVIADYYREAYGLEPVTIAYGAESVTRSAGRTLRKFNLEKDKYILYVSRLEPENNALGVIQAYQQVETDIPLVIVGGAPYAKEYIETLHREADDRVIFTGFQFEDSYEELQNNCLFYVQATEVGGTHPALVEAMCYGNAVIANGTPENQEVLGQCGLFYPKNDFRMLAECMRQYLQDASLRLKMAKRASDRAQAVYNWDRVADAYEALFGEVCASK